MSIEFAYELEGLRRVGRVVTETVRVMAGELRPGVTTARPRRDHRSSARVMC